MQSLDSLLEPFAKLQRSYRWAHHAYKILSTSVMSPSLKDPVDGRTKPTRSYRQVQCHNIMAQASLGSSTRSIVGYKIGPLPSSAMPKSVCWDFVTSQNLGLSVSTFIMPCDVFAVICTSTQGLAMLSDSGRVILGCITSRILRLPQTAQRVALDGVEFLDLQNVLHIPDELYARIPNLQRVVWEIQNPCRCAPFSLRDWYENTIQF